MTGLRVKTRKRRYCQDALFRRKIFSKELNTFQIERRVLENNNGVTNLLSVTVPRIGSHCNHFSTTLRPPPRHP